MAKVLVIRLSSFGDVAMLVPVIYSVAAKYPQDRFSVMTRKSFAPLFENLGFNVNVIPFDINGKHKGIRGLLRMANKLSVMGFTHVADEHDVLRSKIIRFIMRITGHKVACIDKGRKEKDVAIATKKLVPPLKTTVQRYLDVFDKLGFPADITFTDILYFVPREFYNLKAIATEKKGRWVGVAPFAKHKGKIYPLEKMEKVVEMLSKEPDTTIFLLGAGKEEREVLNKWASTYPNVIDTSCKLKLENELLLMSYMDVVLTMDSANMHLASLVKTPVVSVWGATHPNMGFYGFGQDPDNAVQIDLECRPCSVYGDLPCQRFDYACLGYITESMIVDKIHKVLDKQKEKKD